MIVDSSVLIAILRGEPEAALFRAVLEAAEGPIRLSAGTYLETAIVIDGSKNPILTRELDPLLDDADILIEPVTEHQAHIAREAYRDFGKGSGHPAQLNFGDCFAYSLAKDKSEPLLFKGTDFAQTDVRVAKL